MEHPDENLAKETQNLIRKIRKGSTENDFKEFNTLIRDHIEEICRSLDTRWLISVCDTFVDHGDEVTKRNALLVVQLVNSEKLWATYMLMHDIKPNQEKINLLKRNKVIPLWDGMYSFNINHGDMTNNFFHRLEFLLDDTPTIKKIYLEIISRMKNQNTVLANLNTYHGRLFESYPRRSISRIIKKKIRALLKSFRF